MVRHTTIKTIKQKTRINSIKHNKHEKQGGRCQSEKSRSFINYAVKTKNFQKNYESWLFSKILVNLQNNQGKRGQILVNF